LALIPGVRAGFYFRCAAADGAISVIFRNILVQGFACDVSGGAVFEGAIYLPHPVGIVIGRGVHVGTGTTIYQGVTLGADSRGGYPCIGASTEIFANSIVVGDIVVGEGARIGAGCFVAVDVNPGDVVREDRRRPYRSPNTP
jgi:serine O-acetyltransferase